MTSSDSSQPESSPEDNKPIVAKLAGTGDGPQPEKAQETSVPNQPVGEDKPAPEAIRVGSPFAVDPTPIAGTQIRRAPIKPETFYDVGPLRYTAMGAVGAALVVLGFAIVAAWWFPGGGTVIAALGCALSIFGLYSPRRYTASGCLALHLLLFMVSYSRAIAA